MDLPRAASGNLAVGDGNGVAGPASAAKTTSSQAPGLAVGPTGKIRIGEALRMPANSDDHYEATASRASSRKAGQAELAHDADVVDAKRHKSDWHLQSEGVFAALRIYVRRAGMLKQQGRILCKCEGWLAKIVGGAKSPPAADSDVKPASAVLRKRFLVQRPQAWALAILKIALAEDDKACLDVGQMLASVEQDKAILVEFRALEVCIINHHWGQVCDVD